MNEVFVMDIARLSTCSISLNDRSADEAFAAIAAAGYRKVDVHEKIHLTLFPEECDHEALKETADKHGLRIAGLATYVGGGLDGRRIAYGFHDWEVENPERFTRYGFSSTDPEELEEEFQQMRRAINLACFFWITDGARCARRRQTGKYQYRRSLVKKIGGACRREGRVPRNGKSQRRYCRYTRIMC